MCQKIFDRLCVNPFKNCLTFEQSLLYIAFAVSEETKLVDVKIAYFTHTKKDIYIET